MSNHNAANPEVPGDTESQIFPEKHPLGTSWTFYYLDPDHPRHDWKNATKEVLAFDTVEDFWALYNHVTPFSSLRKGSDYSMFRGGLGDTEKIRPEWEDKSNRAGGCWKMNFEYRIKPSDIDDIFRELLMMCIGENFENNGDFVNGIVASARNRQYRLAIWTRDDDKEHNAAIGERILQALPPNQKIQLEFVTHAESQRVSNQRGAEPRPMMTLYKS